MLVARLNGYFVMDLLVLGKSRVWSLCCLGTVRTLVARLNGIF